MLFSSLTFLLLFLPLTIFFYFLTPRKYRNHILLLSSLVFYAWGEPKYILYMIVLVTFNFLSAKLLRHLKNNNRSTTAKIYFILTIFISLSGLIYFKYFNFIIFNFNSLFNINLSFQEITLPLGISFYTFQILSYQIDAYFGKVAVQEKWTTLMTYLSMFPQLIAGPIVRYSTVEIELKHRVESWDQVYIGVSRFIIGLGKKVIIANNVAVVADLIYSQTPLADINFTFAWIGTLAFAFQIYFDFSAYSDMAIGIGKIFGFNFLENFNYPYISTSITDFWRRWHISLGTWFKDYVYIPLGGNKNGFVRWLVNISVVWLLTGLWHGASWNFIYWGIYFAVILIIEKLLLLKLLNKLLFLNTIYSFIIVLFGWVIFNSQSSEQINVFISNMFDYKQGFDWLTLQRAMLVYTWPYFVLAIIGSAPALKLISAKLDKYIFYQLPYMFYLFFVLFLSIMYLVNDNFNPFIYFRF